MDRKREKIFEKIKEFRLFDDDFMSRVFEEDYECMEFVLHIIMGKPDLKVKEVRTQYSIKNLLGRSVRLDIYAIDTSGKVYNIEVQRADKGAGAKRARYNSSIIDANALIPGAAFDDLPEIYVIFITENDVLGSNQPIYHIERTIKGTGQKFGDESHIIYVNGAYQDNTPLGLLMHDFSCKNPEDMHYKLLAEKTRYFKEDKRGVAAMSKIIEDLMEDLKEDLIDNEKRESAVRMLKDGELSLEKISKYSGLTLEQVKELAQLQTV